MENTYWHKQTPAKPLFDDLLWSRPENRRHAGKLLIVGGNVHGFASVAEAYQSSQQAGIGSSRIILPDALKKSVGKLLDNVEYAPSTPSGSFSQQAIADILEQVAWANGVLLAGDFGRNSETAILLENLLQKTTLPLVATKDAVDYLIQSPQPIAKRNAMVLVLTIAQLQKLAQKLHSTEPVTFDMGLLRLVEFLHTFSQNFKIPVVIHHADNLLVAVDGEVSSTQHIVDKETMWRVNTAAFAAVWVLQNPKSVFKALTTAIYTLANAHNSNA